MRKITADYLFTIDTPPIQNGVALVNDNGAILAIEHESDFEPSTLERHKGILVPGFINTHCHLELSHMRGMLPEKTGLIPFIKGVIGTREASLAAITAAIEQSEQEMLENGIVAVGDISNTNHTFQQKAKKNIYYHTFAEIFDLNPINAETEFKKGEVLINELKELGLKGSLAPHAPYTVSPELFKLINKFNTVYSSITSMHNQETEAENRFFVEGTGDFADFYKDWGVDISFFNPSGKNSLPSVLQYLSAIKNILLVHNTFSTDDDVKATQALKKSNVFWCTCPNANLYIENRLPDYEVFIRNKCKVTIGTDSIASNHYLSVLDEIKTISKHFPQIPLQTLLTWATKNGAEMLQINNKYGILAPGKIPGINLLQQVDLENMKLTDETTVKRIV